MDEELIMTVEKFDKLSKRNFEDGAILNKIRTSLFLLSEKEKKIEETEAERHRLSKLLIEARTRIRELEEEIEKIVKSEYMNSLIIKEKLASLLKKE